MAKFTDVFIDVTKHGRKLPTSEYKESGANPIIDQGQSEIAGFTDEKEGLFENVPAIIFGDHTRVIKYIDKPFFLGADGVKILKAKDINANYKFLFYVLSSARIPNTGYNRHFKWLKEVEIPECSREDETYIVTVFDKIESLINDRKQQLLKLDELVKSRFIELFGDVSDYINITDIAHTYIGLVTTMTKHYCNSGTPLLFNSSIKSEKIIWDGTYLDAEFAEANKSRMHKTNDIITVHTGDIGTSAVIGEEFNNSLGFATIVTRINDTSRYYPRFVSSFLNYGSGKEQLKKYSRDVRNNLNLKDFNRLMVPNVSALEQKRYVDFLEQTDKSKFEVKESLEKLETLKKSLMQKYFG